MTDLEKKHEKVVDKIAKEMELLDAHSSQLDNLDEDTEKKHHFKKWVLEKKMIHEVKKILHEAGKYEKYDEKEFEKEIKLCEKLEKDLA
ncbi:hypothetical protein ACYSNO_05920 [Enterococcus sp. LJL98]